MPPATWWVFGALIATLAFALRVAVHIGREPGGVDTWYYLAYADAFRRRPSLDVRLPQYLLQDEVQSYPPLFPSLLALVPSRLLRKGFWAVSPLVDCAHLAFLHYVAWRLTSSVVVAALASSAYAVTPHLISETRSMNPRAFGALLHSLVMVISFKALISGGHWPWLVAAVGLGAALMLSSAALAAAYVFVSAALTLVFDDWRQLAVATAALAVAFAVSGGRFGRVVLNYVHAVDYWRRNRRLYGAHPVRDSPVLAEGAAPQQPVAARPGFLSETPLTELVRLIGENPFLLVLPLMPHGFVPWGPRLYAWAVSLAALAVLATIVPPLRAFGPGRSYMKAAVFPTAYCLAFGIGTPAGLLRPLGLVALACVAMSAAAIVFFYVYVRGRVTEQTASVPAGLRDAVRALAALPDGGVFVLPYMYADYVCYNSGKPVLWGGHCGRQRRFEAIAPVIARPLGELFAEYGVRYVLLDLSYAAPSELRLGSAPTAAERFGSLAILKVG